MISRVTDADQVWQHWGKVIGGHKERTKKERQQDSEYEQSALALAPCHVRARTKGTIFSLVNRGAVPWKFAGAQELFPLEACSTVFSRNGSNGLVLRSSTQQVFTLNRTRDYRAGHTTTASTKGLTVGSSNFLIPPLEASSFFAEASFR